MTNQNKVALPIVSAQGKSYTVDGELMRRLLILLSERWYPSGNQRDQAVVAMQDELEALCLGQLRLMPSWEAQQPEIRGILEESFGKME